MNTPKWWEKGGLQPPFLSWLSKNYTPNLKREVF